MNFYEFAQLLDRLKNLFRRKKSSHIAYTGVVLYPLDQKKLLSNFKNQIPPSWQTHGNHMTINVGSAADGPAKEWVGRTVQLRVVAVGINELAMAVKIESKVPSNNTVKHITIATSPEGSAKDSNTITKWSPVDPYYIKGAIQEVPTVGEPRKERIHTPQSAPAPNDPQEFVKMLAGKPEHVIRNALAGKFPNATPEQIEKWIGN